MRSDISITNFLFHFVKEAQKAKIEMTRNNSEIQKIKQYKRLPALARMIR